MNEQERFVAELIERGLERAGEVEPLAGLEERLLGKLEAGHQQRVRWWWMAAPVAAMLILVALIYWRPQPGRPVVTVENAPPQKMEAPAAAQDAARTMAKRPSKFVNAPARSSAAVVAAAQSSPRQEVFPAPLALSDEERVLMAFARRQPLLANRIVEERSRPIRDVEIEPIEIELLEIPTSNGIQEER